MNLYSIDPFLLGIMSTKVSEMIHVQDTKMAHAVNIGDLNICHRQLQISRLYTTDIATCLCSQ